MTTERELIERIRNADGEAGAVFSDDRAHRLFLWRHKPDLFLDDGYGRALFVMLNPSTADETANDMTIKKCVGFAKPFGATSIGVVNLFTACATVPQDLIAMQERNHEHADAAIEAAVEWAKARPGARLPIIFAYGMPPWAGARRDSTSLNGQMFRAQIERIDTVVRILDRHGRPPMCLGLTEIGWPRHPSRLGYDRGGDDTYQLVPDSHFGALGLKPPRKA